MFKMPANASPLGDKAEIDARYRYWRRHILMTIWLGYALFYFTRKSFNAAAPEILASGVMTRTDIGLLATRCFTSPTACRSSSPASSATAPTRATLWASG